ncbi:MAG: Tn7 transposase TnsA N-terminal domain-containing protein [Thermoguttaceae bacterium]
MATSKRVERANPQKSPWNFEKCDSILEWQMANRLENDPTVVKWMKRHGVTIPWIDVQGHQRRYVPDFLVEYSDGSKIIIEVKDPTRLDSDDVKRKRSAAELWCKQRGMTYRIETMW